jgi:hypothetical protein
VEPEVTAVSRQELSKHLPAATTTHVTIDILFSAVFSGRFMMRLYEDQWDKLSRSNIPNTENVGHVYSPSLLVLKLCVGIGILHGPPP